MSPRCFSRGALALLIVPLTGLAEPAPGSPPDDIAALRRELDVVKGKLPDQSHVMKDVAYHFTNLWFAGKQQNWPLAKFYCDETRAHLKWAVRVLPVRKVSSGQLELQPLLEALDHSVFTALSDAVREQSVEKFEEAYRRSMDGCYSCHQASEKPFLRLHLPERPEAEIIEFRPPE